MNLPKARTNDLLEQEADSELLIYDLRVDKAYNLNETLKNVFASCGGKLSFDDLKRKYGYTDDLIHLALQELNANNLLEDYDGTNHFAGLSRREVIRKVGLATMVALPVIASLTAPKAAHAASSCSTVSCTSPGNCTAPCTRCAGDGRCGQTGESCTGIGTSCESSGQCFDNVCDNGGACNSDLDCIKQATCQGTGSCAA